MILIDFRKASDTLNHKILLDKMECIALSGKIITWFHSYFTNRAFFVLLDNVFSEAGTINCKVLCCINDIPQAQSNNYMPVSRQNWLFYQHTDVMEIGNVLNKNVANMCKCFDYSKLSIHLKFRFIMVKIMLNAFFSLGKKPVRA